jgi:hypothetical protein
MYWWLTILIEGQLVTTAVKMNLYSFNLNVILVVIEPLFVQHIPLDLLKTAFCSHLTCNKSHFVVRAHIGNGKVVEYLRRKPGWKQIKQGLTWARSFRHTTRYVLLSWSPGTYYPPSWFHPKYIHYTSLATATSWKKRKFQINIRYFSQVISELSTMCPLVETSTNCQNQCLLIALQRYDSTTCRFMSICIVSKIPPKNHVKTSVHAPVSIQKA